MDENKKRLLLPGDEIGTTEEYIAGEGTYEKDGLVCAATTGYLDIDTNEMIARVAAVTSEPVVLKANDLVLGSIYDLKGSMAIVDVSKVIGKDRAIATGDSNGALHISKVQKDFLQDINTAFKIGDIIRAKVLQAEPSLQLTTEGKNLGVILAKCIECQIPLERKGKELICPQCEKKYRKKLADDFGKAKI